LTAQVATMPHATSKPIKFKRTKFKRITSG
jgi:hypothetical protein